MARDPRLRQHREWLAHLQPVGLVVSPGALCDLGYDLDRDAARQKQRLLEDHLEDVPAGDDAIRPGRALRDFDAFAAELLGWPKDRVAGAPGGPELPADVRTHVAEAGETLAPSRAVLQLEPERKPSLVVQLLPRGQKLDEPTPGVKFSLSPQLRMERLLRDTGVAAGLLVAAEELRLVYAPVGESSGHLTFPLYALEEVAGRPLLAAFSALLGPRALVNGSSDVRLPALLRASRAYQNEVSTHLSEQVLHALGELARGFEAADPERRHFGRAVGDDDEHVYGGLLAVMLRLVFLLYAEEQDVLPSDGRFRRAYGVSALYEKLAADAGLHPDTMDQRFGAWARLLALFRIVHEGVRHGALRIPARHGELFDPGRWGFLEGRPYGATRQVGERLEPPRISDGVVHRILKHLLVVDGERLSYRALDVEQIGSVYESLMGFTVKRAKGRSIGVRSNLAVVDLDELLRVPAKDRKKRFSELTDLDNAALLDAVAKAERPEDVVAALGDARRSPLTPYGLVPADGVILEPTEERRKTGSHYTPRSLTAPIVAKTLEPLLLAMGEKPPAERILRLKLCDPAMGSGAFLVEACRQVAAEVVKAWDRDGTRPKGLPADEDVQLAARRLVAQRCLYGVDKNAFAVPLAKLSLWLVTLARGEPFTFLDHALRHGDSLVGLDLAQLQAFHWKRRGNQLTLVSARLRKALDEALGLRQEILALAEPQVGETVEDREKREARKARLLREADEALDDLRVMADLVVAAFFSGKKGREDELERLGRLSDAWLKESGRLPPELREVREALHARLRGRPLHWPLEFPEIFTAERPDPLDADAPNKVAWIDGFVGNPPYAGKNAITEAHGEGYIDWLKEQHEGAHGNADLSAHFFRRAFDLLGEHGALGLVATKTIAQGDTRATGLQHLVRSSGAIHAATRAQKWTGAANVTVAVVHVAKGRLASLPLARVLDGRVVEAIDSRLRAKPERPDPVPLAANEGLGFQGSIVLGMGFTLTPEERAALVERNPRNAERIFPYLGGEEVNSSPTQAHHRYVIDFGDMSEDEAKQWPDLYRRVRDLVKPERDKLADNADGRHRKRFWWQFGRMTPALNVQLLQHRTCLVNSQVSKHLVFARQPTTQVFGHTLYVFLIEDWARFGVMQSRLHEAWAWLLSSSMRGDLRYSAADAFRTFPFPPAGSLAPGGELDRVASALLEARAARMKASNQGLTTTYNRLKDPHETDPDILALRSLHLDLDRAVLDAYGWTDLAVPPYAPDGEAEEAAVTSFAEECCDRLFVLNAERAAEESRAKLRGELSPKAAKKPRAAGKKGAKRA